MPLAGVVDTLVICTLNAIAVPPCLFTKVFAASIGSAKALSAPRRPLPVLILCETDFLFRRGSAKRRPRATPAGAARRPRRCSFAAGIRKSEAPLSHPQAPFRACKNRSLFPSGPRLCVAAPCGPPRRANQAFPSPSRRSAFAARSLPRNPYVPKANPPSELLRIVYAPTLR